ncbi:MAG: hypothetical protein JWP80_4692 [Pseudomonas sp.]|nr:hypothetical protein [Pseudomonas sp.]
MQNKKKVVLAGVLGVVVSLGSVMASANTETSISVSNTTADRATFGYEYFTGSVSPTPSDIDPGRSTRFELTSFGYYASGLRFTYTAGNKKCRFSASHTAVPSLGRYIPRWKKNGESVGRARATCTATISNPRPDVPFNYSVNFSIQ